MAKSPKTDASDALSALGAKWASDKTHVSLRLISGQKFRAGERITQSPTILAKANLSPAQARAILDDADLVIEEIDDPAPKAEA